MCDKIDPDLLSSVRALLPGEGWTLTPVVDNHNLVLRAMRDAEDLAIRLHPTRRMNAITARAIVACLLALADDAAIRAPLPRRLITGGWFASVDRGGRDTRVSAVTWVPGEPAPTARAFVEEDRLQAIGAVVARLHERTLRRPPTSEESEYVPKLEAFLESPTTLDNAALRSALPRDLHERLLSAREPMRTVLGERVCTDQVGVIHADLEPQNWVFENDCPGVIDFDELRIGPLSLDLLGVLWTHAMWDDFPGYRDALLLGYGRVRPLPPDTRKRADVLMAIHFARWLETVFSTLPESEGAPLIEPAQRMVERVVKWCAA